MRDQPPQTRSWSAGHSGSTRSSEREAVRRQEAHPVAEGAVVLDVGDTTPVASSIST